MHPTSSLSLGTAADSGRSKVRNQRHRSADQSNAKCPSLSSDQIRFDLTRTESAARAPIATTRTQTKRKMPLNRVKLMTRTNLARHSIACQMSAIPFTDRNYETEASAKRVRFRVVCTPHNSAMTIATSRVGMSILSACAQSNRSVRHDGHCPAARVPVPIRSWFGLEFLRAKFQLFLSRPESLLLECVSSSFALMPFAGRRVVAFALAFVNPGHGEGLTKPAP